MRDFFQALGHKIVAATDTAGFSLVILWRSTLWIRSIAAKRREILAQCYVCGIESMPVTMIVTMFSGMILALQTGIQLARYGGQDLIGALVSVTLAREMAPFMTGLILAANVGSAMAAEIGTMSVSEEIDAMRIMAIDPARFLVLPRLLAMAVMCPIITAYSDLIGIIGAAIVSRAQLGVSFRVFKTEAISALLLKDIETGFFKAFIFGVVIAIVGCTQGLRAAGGAIGVGHATRRSVVISYILIIMLGYYITWFFYR